MADNVHWLRDTYGPALRAFYRDLLNQPIPQRHLDLIAGFAAEPVPDAVTSSPKIDSGHPVAAKAHEPQPDASE